ncbi:hypothetical protein SAMN05216276_1009162 [Streptosporangium subroseum]|uniref:Uncharacterized protein n=1 Tax=Streptosporangium subroseum TaxID=106412 RepID=A0A239EI34_9ACTN|nr:hypothetical protein SAMN05216276_1009162 [Streptosporangium subroseum]
MIRPRPGTGLPLRGIDSGLTHGRRCASEEDRVATGISGMGMWS